MGITKFFIRLIILATACLLVIAGVFYVTYAKYPRRALALVHVSNSISYNSNLQNLVANTDVDSIQCLVIGSSISLDNLSAKLLTDSLGRRTYNLSSWGFPLDGTLNLIRILRLQQCRHVVMAFNNMDFVNLHLAGPGIHNGTNYDFAESKYFLQGSWPLRGLTILKTFNFMQFNSDTKYKDSAIKQSGLDFDAYGSTLLDPERFPRDGKKPLLYKDTSGFHDFYTGLIGLRELLKKRNCDLVLVYCPFRNGTLNTDQQLACDAVAQQMAGQFGSRFIDLHREQLADSLYWDEAHLYRDGAIALTKQTIKKIKQQRGTE